jgi:RNA polymerase-binding transcription factor DksA
LSFTTKKTELSIGSTTLDLDNIGLGTCPVCGEPVTLKRRVIAQGKPYIFLHEACQMGLR